MTGTGAQHICTMVDEDYLCFGLALHESLREHAPEWTLHAICLDEPSHMVLSALDLEGIRPVRFAALTEDEPGLSVAREARPRHDFVWTVKPFALRHVLAAARDAAAVTWLDADAICFSPLDALLDELGDASVLLAPQDVSPAFRWVEERTGSFMSGLIAFRADETGRNALDWWAARCLYGGCPRTPDRHRFGDQKYLQSLPDLFRDVRVSSNPGLWLAPSNIERHELSEGSRGPLVDGRPVTVYQYTGFRMQRSGGYEATFPPWRIGTTERKLLYDPFAARLQRSRQSIQTVIRDFDAGFAPPRTLMERAMGAGSRAKGSLLRARQRLHPSTS